MPAAPDHVLEQDLPLGADSAGPAVRDLQRRLAELGHDCTADTSGTFGPATTAAVQALQHGRGLDASGVVDPPTWQALIEAGYRLGDRPLYQHRPMLRGDDVADLQLRLGSLGFDAGWVDGIFGPDTERALKDFQRNAGVPTDGIAGPKTVAELNRLGAKSAATEPVVRVREREHLRRRAGTGLVDQRVIVGEIGTLGALADATGRELRQAGASVLTLHGPDLSEQARIANRFAGDAYLGFTSTREERCELRYFRTDNFESWGGRALAHDTARQLEQTLDGVHIEVVGSRLAVLRETRMPAIWCELGPVPAVVRRHHAIAAAFSEALAHWGDALADDDMT